MSAAIPELPPEVRAQLPAAVAQVLGIPPTTYNAAVVGAIASNGYDLFDAVSEIVSVAYYLDLDANPAPDVGVLCATITHDPGPEPEVE